MCFLGEGSPLAPWLVSVLAVQMMQRRLGIIGMSVEERVRGSIQPAEFSIKLLLIGLPFTLWSVNAGYTKVTKICSSLSRRLLPSGSKQTNATQCDRCYYSCKYRWCERLQQGKKRAIPNREESIYGILEAWRHGECEEWSPVLQVWQGIGRRAQRNVEMEGVRPGHKRSQQRFLNFLSSLLS